MSKKSETVKLQQVLDAVEALRAEVKGLNQRLAAYTPIETDPKLDAELRRLIRAGMETDQPLPTVPKHFGGETAVSNRRARRFRR